MKGNSSNRRVFLKNKQVANKPTLDIHHQQFLTKVNDKQIEKESLELKIIELEERIKQVSTQLKNTTNDAEKETLFSTLIALQDEKSSSYKRVKQIKESFNVTNYLVDTANVLFKYYDIVEKGTDSPKVNNVNNGIMKFFTAQEATNVAEPDTLLEVDDTRGGLLNAYLQKIDPMYIDPNCQYECEEQCKYCKSTDIVTLANDGYVLCNKCHSIEYIIIDHEKPSYRDPPKEISFYAYKRSNHLNEWLSQIQGKESTDIPEEVYDKILVEIKKLKITNMADVTPKKVREILRKLQINKYEHIPHIINRLTGKPIIQMPPELEDKLRTMFRQVQGPFLRHSPANRKNFLSYSYCLHKMLQLLAEDEYLPLFSLLKSKDKLHLQDSIWRKICADLDWEFIPST
jgi:hypothetical protein